MAIVAKKGAQRELIPPGTYPARCIKVMHFGNVPGEYLGKKQIKDEVRFTWELPTELRVFEEEKGEQPLSISKDYTLSLGEKANLRRDLESWRGKQFTDDELEGFDILSVMSVPCMLNVIHKMSKAGNQYTFIASITPLLKGYECPSQINPSFIWDYDENYDEGVLENLHDWFKDKIKSSLEYQAKVTPPENIPVNIQQAPMPGIDDAPPPDGDDNDLPF